MLLKEERKVLDNIIVNEEFSKVSMPMLRNVVVEIEKAINVFKERKGNPIFLEALQEFKKEVIMARRKLIKKLGL